MRFARGKERRSRRWLVPAGAALIVEAAGTFLSSGRLGGDLVVRCRDGHLFTTLWIPGASVKALRLGWWRFQYCPVGRHWSLVRPVHAAELGEADRRAAGEAHDLRIP